MIKRTPPEPRVAILLSTFNGEAYLHDQLESFLQQTHEEWVLYWRDDGSTDRTRAVMSDFARRAGQGRCVEIDQETSRLGASASFHSLLRAVSDRLEAADVVAFADQDDVWLPQKLERGIAALSEVASPTPAIYCARQILVDRHLREIAISHGPIRSTCFPASLIQNVATGCTVMLNQTGARLVAASTPSPTTLHDWWCYMVVVGAGGRLLQDEEPVILYRQHGSNLVGAPTSFLRRAIAALRRGPSVFMNVLRLHVAALVAQPHLLSTQALQDAMEMQAALSQRGLRRRLATLRMAGLTRQNWAETMVFRCWFLFG